MTAEYFAVKRRKYIRRIIVNFRDYSGNERNETDLKEFYLVQDKTPKAKIICTTGDQRDPSNAFEAATALAEVIKCATDCDIDIIAPDLKNENDVNVTIAVTGDGTDASVTLDGDAFSVSVNGGNVYILAGNVTGIWNAMAYFVSAVIGYDPYTGKKPEVRDSIKLPETLSYTFNGSPAPQPLIPVEPDGAFKVTGCGDTYYEQLLEHTAFLYRDNLIPCCYSGEHHEYLIRKAVAQQRLIWNATGDCHCDHCSRHEGETGEKAYSFCKCPTCTAAAEREGTLCGAYFDIVREAAARLAKVDPDAYLTIAATSVTLDPPKTYLGDNVRVVVADRMLCSSHPISEDSCERNAAFAKKLRAWRKLCGSLYVIDFTSDYYYFPATFPSFDIMRRNAAFYHEVGVDGVFFQFDRMQSELEFSDIRMILADAILKRPTMSADEFDKRMDNALVHVYGTDAAPVIRRYIDRFTELALDGHCFDTHSRPHEVLSLKNDKGEYDLSFAKEAYKMWDSIHPHPEALARNELYLARMLFTQYQAQPVCYSKTQFSEWLMDCIHIYDRGRALEEIIAD